MSDFKQAIEWMKEERKVRRPTWMTNIYCKYSKHVWDGSKMKEGIFFFDDDTENTKKYEFIFNDFEATDWEIYDEGFKITRRSESERVAYLVGKYFTGEITLKFLNIQLNAIEEPIEISTTG